MSYDSYDSSVTSSSSSSSPQLGQQQQQEQQQQQRLLISEEPKDPLGELLPDLSHLYKVLKDSIKFATLRGLRETTILRNEDMNETERFLESKYGGESLEDLNRPTKVAIEFSPYHNKILDDMKTQKIRPVEKLLFFEIDGCTVRLSCVEFQASNRNFTYSDVATVVYTQNDYDNGNDQLNIFIKIITSYLEKNNRIEFFNDQDTILVAFSLGTPKAYHSTRDIRYPRHGQTDSLHEDFVGHNLVDCFQFVFDYLRFNKKFRIVTISGVTFSNLSGMYALNNNMKSSENMIKLCFNCFYGVKVGIYGESKEVKRDSIYIFDDFGTYKISDEWESIEKMIECYEKDIFNGSFMNREEVYTYVASPAYLNEMLEFYLLKLIMKNKIEPNNRTFKIRFREFDAFSQGVDIAEIFMKEDFDRFRDQIITYIKFLSQRACVFASIAFLALTEEIFYKEIEPRFDYGETPEIDVYIKASYYETTRKFHNRLKCTLIDLASNMWTRRRTDYEKPRFNFLKDKDGEILGACLFAMYHNK